MKQDCWPDHIDCDHREYIGRAVSLAGHEAKVVKDDSGYAWVAPLDPSLASAGYSWTAIFCVCDLHDGRFR